MQGNVRITSKAESGHQVGRMNLTSVALGMLALVVVAGVMIETRLPRISDDRAAFVALAIVGVTMCGAGGIGRAQAALGWAHPITFAGIGLGIAASVLVTAVLAGWAAILSPLSVFFYGDEAAAASLDRAAFVALAIVMAIKWALGFGMSRSR